MAISKTAVQNRLRPFILAQVDPKVIDNLTNQDFEDLFNDVGKDLNEIGELRIENFYKKTNSTNAEDSGLTNYKTQRRILKVFSLKYEDDGYADIIWTYIYEDADGDGRIVFKDDITSAIQLDIWYLGDIEKVDDGTDEIDLPDNVLPEFMELCRKKILVDYSQNTELNYEQALDHYARKARMKQDKRIMDKQGIRPYWLGLTGDKALLYQIDKQWVSSADNVYLSGTDYVFYT